ncbi:MAG: hypothetical protein ABSG52_15975 [Terriglobales bacterium]
MDQFSILKIEKLLTDKPVMVWLSPEGRMAVKQIFEGKESFRTLVQAVDELGLWLRLPRRSGQKSTDSLLLLKWVYLATAQVDAELPASDLLKEAVH